MISASQDWLVSSGSGDARQREDLALCANSHMPRRVLFCVAVTNPKSVGFRVNQCQEKLRMKTANGGWYLSYL